ncbi:MAG: argininosuccinate lyase [Clostridia bacterium]|nr:argininosuccinate lyase [Clostridia bacterium]
MGKLWAGLDSGNVSGIADDFNSSIKFDKRLYKEDIAGSIAHAHMLFKCGIISKADADALVKGLSGISEDIASGALKIDETAEDIHTFVEETLISRVGAVGKKLHTARSRNDQVALDFRLYILKETKAVQASVKALVNAVADKAEEYKDAVCPGYTHLQRAQPITFGHHLMAYAFMLIRDYDRFSDALKRISVSPIGSCALAGTTYNTDRAAEAEELGLSRICENSIDGVSDRDFVAEFISCCALLQTHLSRFAEEIILWTSWEFKFVSLSGGFTTGSSIMPQKRNSDMAELVRGKTGRVIGDLTGILTVLKGLPLAYNKDMQEDKELAFDAADTVKACLDVFAPMVATMIAHRENMKAAAQKGFINATDLADYLTKKGEPFRSAYKICGEIVGYCIEKGKMLETLSLEEYKTFSDLFDGDLYQAIDIENCVNKRISAGGTSVASVEKQICAAREFLSKR